MSRLSARLLSKIPQGRHHVLEWIDCFSSQRRKWTSNEFHWCTNWRADRKRAEEELRRSEELQRQQKSLSASTNKIGHGHWRGIQWWSDCACWWQQVRWNGWIFFNFLINSLRQLATSVKSRWSGQRFSRRKRRLFVNLLTKLSTKLSYPHPWFLRANDEIDSRGGK